MKRANRATVRVQVARQLPVACFYCDERFRRTQERATHIRRHHPGKAYRPDLEKERREADVAPLLPPAAPGKGIVRDIVLAQPKPGEWRLDDEMTSRQHLVAAIASIKRRQEAIAKQMPELEIQLESLRAAQKQTDTERQALETALATIEGEAVEQIQSLGVLAKAGD